MVLTVQTTEVTPRAGHRQTSGAWVEMVERLLLDRINGQRTRLPVNLADEYPFVVPATTASSRLTRGYTTVMRTE